MDLDIVLSTINNDIDIGFNSTQTIKGEKGDKGDKGDTGAGVAAGGVEGQVLSKVSDEDYDTNWITLTADSVGALSKDNPSGTGSFAVGYNVEATGTNSHAEGSSTHATGAHSHAEGSATYATGYYSHAEGYSTTARGTVSHAEGEGTVAYASRSHAEGYYTYAGSEYQHVQGKCNIIDTSNKYAHILGNGNTFQNRSNAHTIDWSGNAWFAGKVTDGTNNVLSDKQNKSDEALSTTDKTIVGAINELNSTIGTLNDSLEGVLNGN